MKKMYKHEIVCEGCGHRYILLIDRPISQELYNLWTLKVYREHMRMEEENEEEN